MHDERRQDKATSAEIEGAVLDYLRSHPEAADTLEGIVEWWLPRQRYATARERIARVLADLVGAGLLRRDPLPGGGELYALNDRGRTPPR
jgi:hypothetical protein